jgi:probable phosphoglycerate mutase
MQGGDCSICAPFGLDDLLGLIVRPNPRQITREIYEVKVARWRHSCTREATRSLKLDALYGSDLGRAPATSRCISAASQRQIIVRPELREWNKGIFQGLTRDEAETRLPRETGALDRLGDDYEIPGGESGKEFRYRCERTFTGLAERHPGEVIVIITHGGVLRRLFEFVIGLSESSGRQFKRSSASINVFTFAHDSWALETWGDTSHLDARQD